LTPYEKGPYRALTSIGPDPQGRNGRERISALLSRGVILVDEISEFH
jgi:hypothetical protein